MAGTAAAIKAGSAYVELFLKDTLSGGLKSLSGKMHSFGSGVAGLGVPLLAAGAGMLAPFTMAISAASEAQETINKFRAVFGDQADAAEAFSLRLADTVGRSATEIQAGMSSLQGMFIGLGFGPQAAAMSEQLAGLTLDFASFHNVTDEEAMQRFIAALGGSSEVFDKFGINIKEAALNAELLAMGLGVTSQQATEQQKVMARLGIIQKAMGAQGATGDAVKTAGSYANSMKRLQAGFHNLAVEIGTAVLPVVTEVVNHFATGGQYVLEFVRKNQELIQVWAGVGAGAVALGAILVGLGGTIHLLAFGVSGLSMAVGLLGTILGVVFSPVGLGIIVVAALAAGLVYLVSQIDGVGEHAEGVAERASAAWNDISTSFMKAWGGIADAMKAGDLELAGQIAMAGLNLSWQQALGHMTDGWANFTGFIGDSMHESFRLVAHGFNETFRGIENVMNTFRTGLTIMWTEMVRDMKIAFADLIHSTLSGLLELANSSSVVAGALSLAGIDQESVDRRRDEATAAARDEADTAIRATSLAGRKREVEILAERNAIMNMIDEISRQEQEARAALRRAEAGGNREAIQAAEAELARFVEMAQVAAGIAEENEMARAADRAAAGPQGPQSAMAGMKQASVGSFNAAEIAGAFAGGGGPEERVARNTETLVELTRRMVTMLQDGAGGLLFG